MEGKAVGQAEKYCAKAFKRKEKRKERRRINGKKGQEMGKERKRKKAEVTLTRCCAMVGGDPWKVRGSASEEPPSVGLKSTNRVVGPSDTAQHLNSQEQNSKRSVVGPDVGTFPEHQKILDWDLAEGRELNK